MTIGGRGRCSGLGSLRAFSRLEVPAVEVGVLLGEEEVDHLHTLFETGHPLADRPEVDPVGVGLQLVPAGTEPDLETTARDDIERGRHGCQDRGMPVVHPVDHGPHPDPGGRLGQGGEGDPRLETGPVGVSRVSDRSDRSSTPTRRSRCRRRSSKPPASGPRWCDGSGSSPAKRGIAPPRSWVGCGCHPTLLAPVPRPDEPENDCSLARSPSCPAMKRVVV